MMSIFSLKMKTARNREKPRFFIFSRSANTTRKPREKVYIYPPLKGDINFLAVSGWGGCFTGRKELKNENREKPREIFLSGQGVFRDVRAGIFRLPTPHSPLYFLKGGGEVINIFVLQPPNHYI